MTNFELLENVNFDNKYKHVLDFENAQAQEDYFDTKVHSTFTKFSTVRQNQEVKIDLGLNDMFGVNYCRYENEVNGTTKTFYAFIVRKEYVAYETTRLILEVDVYQTYMFDYTIKESFIEREHSDRWEVDTTDTSKLNPIFNIQDEQLNYGEEYKKNTVDIYSNSLIKSTIPDLKFLYVFTTESISDNPISVTNYDFGNPIPYHVYVIPYSETYDLYIRTSSYPALNVNSFITKYRSDVKVKHMVVSKIAPLNITSLTSYNGGYIIDFDDSSSSSGDAYYSPNEVDETNNNGKYAMKFWLRNNLTKMTSEVTDIPVKTDLQKLVSGLSISNNKSMDYEPKLKIFPYNFTKINFSSKEIFLKNEFLENDTKIKCFQSMADEVTSALMIYNYKTSSENELDPSSVFTNQMPYYVSLVTDAWQSYLATNKASRLSGYLTAGLSVGAGIVTAMSTGGMSKLAGIGLGGSGFSQITGQLAKEKDIKNTPDDIKQFNGDISFSKISDNYFARKTTFEILDEYKSKIFNYLYNFGYTVNDFKVPDLRSRFYFNYIKTIEVNMTSNLDNDIIDQLKSIYNNGVTIWHYRTAVTFNGIHNYEKENVEMSLIS